MRIAVKVNFYGMSPSWHSVELSLVDVARQMIEYRALARDIGIMDNPMLVQKTWHCTVVREAEKAPANMSDHLERAEPMFHIEEIDGCWLFVTWHYADSNESDMMESGCFFCFREDEGTPFRHFLVPENALVDVDGTFSMTSGRHLLRFPARRKPWPWPLVDASRYISVGMLNELLDPHDTNPLTMLLRSPNPYKGLGGQIAERLRRIRNEVVANIPRPPVGG